MSLDSHSPSMKLWHRLLAAGDSEDEATELMHGYAHELAERQRVEMQAPGRSYDASRWNRCVGMTADLIDPQTQQPPVDEYRLSMRRPDVSAAP